MSNEVEIVNNKPQKLYAALTMSKAKKIADELVRFVKANQLTAHIAGKEYLLVEAWQFVGETQMGLTQVVTECERVQTDIPKEIKYKAVVEVFNQQGTIVSRGFAFCSNLEKKKTSFEEFSVASMAQTRAIGKAYRNILAWIVRMAGYEATPAEEIDRDRMESDLNKVKANVFKKFKDAGITDAEEMLNVIRKVTGKETIDNADDGLAVIAELSSDDEA